MLESWEIPEHILAAAPESPWDFPPELFRRRADAAIRRKPSPSHRRALEGLPDQGTVLDVGVGAGAASLPLASRASIITGVDSSETMLGEFERQGRKLGVRTDTVLGTWPDAAPLVSPADVVVCNHVLFNVPDLAPFVSALVEKVLGRLVVEITDRHPLSLTNDLWMRFHSVERPSGPTADDAEAAMAGLGVPVRREDHLLPPVTTGFERREDAVAFIRRRLCLAAERDPEIAEALGDRLACRKGLWSAGPARQVVVTLWWDR